MNAAVGDVATSVQDVQAQSAGQPTAAQQAEGATATAGADATAGQAGGAQLQTLLAQAEGLQTAGDEAGCMAVIEQAKQATAQ
jgi:hypothetical protein